MIPASAESVSQARSSLAVALSGPAAVQSAVAAAAVAAAAPGVAASLQSTEADDGVRSPPAALINDSKE